MEVEFGDDDLDRLETDRNFTAGFAPEIVRGFRKALQSIRSAVDERDLYRGGLRMEKLKGKRQHQHSLRLNSQWRLIVELAQSNENKTKVLIVEIADYH